jgi:ABC-type multidrug transport system fused ATPase/permease subunit
VIRYAKRQSIEGKSSMKRSYVSRLNRNGTYYLSGAFLLLIGVPLYQLLVLLPQGYSDALSAADKGLFSPYLSWLGTHLAQFLGYRAILFLAFATFISLPFTLFRIIIAQELLERTEENQLVEDEEDYTEDASEDTDDIEDEDDIKRSPDTEKSKTSPAQDGEVGENDLPTDAWRGKGFAVLAAWTGFLGILFYLLGTLASSIYFAIVGSGFTSHSATPGGFSALSSTFTIISNTVGGGLLALSSLFFGIVIARRGLNLWPVAWVIFGYVALAVGALLSGSAVAVVSSPIEGQAALTTPAILLLALWVLWFGIMLVRLRPEAQE